VSPRRTRRAAERRPAAPVPGPVETVEEWGNGRWAVRRVAARPGEQRIYRCPGCDQELPAGAAHVVAWPLDGVFSGVEHRRHWHTACWAHRDRRGPRR
jgi:hypothetical protein